MQVNRKWTFWILLKWFRLNLRETVSIRAKALGSLLQIRGTQRQFLENISSKDDLRSGIFGTFVVKFIACLSLLGFSNIQEMV